jgi:hypothetical protein
MHSSLVQQSDAPPHSPRAGASVGVIWIALVIAALFVAVVLPRLRRRRDGPREPLGTFGSSTGGAREELERLLTEIQDLSREHIARLDTKIRMLNQLLLECDQKKRELEALLGRSVLPAGALAKAGEPVDKPPVPRAVNPLHDQVYSLQDSGKEVLDICAATGLEKGEVELILGLRRMEKN